MSTSDLVAFAATYYPHASAALGGFAARHIAPGTWRRASAAVVSLARAIVAHADGNDAEALNQAKYALKDAQVTLDLYKAKGAVTAPEPTPPPGTVASWPK